MVTILTEAMPCTSMLISVHNHYHITDQLKYVLLMQHTGPCAERRDNWKHKDNLFKRKTTATKPVGPKQVGVDS